MIHMRRTKSGAAHFFVHIRRGPACRRWRQVTHISQGVIAPGNH